MPAGKKQKTNAIFYALVTFVTLFIISTTVAVIYYVKAEDYRTTTAALQGRLDEMADSKELRTIGTIIGSEQRGKSRLGTMLDYFDQMVSLIIGGPLEETSAEEKVAAARRKFEQMSAKLPDIDPNSTSLVLIIEKIETELQNARKAENTLQEELEKLQNRFDDAIAANFEKEQKLLAEKENYRQKTEQVEKDYHDLRNLVEQTSEEQVRMLTAQLDEEKSSSRELKRDLLKTQAQLKLTQERMEHTRRELAKLVPPPDEEAAAFKADGKIILIDKQADIVHLDLGSSDHVYRGLTFSVYEKNMPIPKSGRGKAEIEIFNVQQNISAARIIRSEIKNPIVLNDTVANLIWDKDQANVFVVAGDFDLDGDGIIDYEGTEKITALIEKWDGKTQKDISVNTDFLVLGEKPAVLRKPTFEQLEVDPMAMQKYEDSMRKFEHYQQVISQAEALSVPIFNLERFLYLIGYKDQSTKPGAF